MNSPEHAVVAAQEVPQELSISHVIASTRIPSSSEVFDTNSSYWNKPSSEHDIRAVQLGEWMSSFTQKEQDIALVAKLYTDSWRTLHVDVAIRNNKPGNERALHVVATFHALQRLEQAHLLTEGLPQHAIDWLNDASSATKER